MLLLNKVPSRCSGFVFYQCARGSAVRDKLGKQSYTQNLLMGFAIEQRMRIKTMEMMKSNERSTKNGMMRLKGLRQGSEK